MTDQKIEGLFDGVENSAGMRRLVAAEGGRQSSDLATWRGEEVGYYDWEGAGKRRVDVEVGSQVVMVIQVLYDLNLELGRR